MYLLPSLSAWCFPRWLRPFVPAQSLAQTSARNCKLTVGSISQNKTHNSQHHPTSQKNTTFHLHHHQHYHYSYHQHYHQEHHRHQHDHCCHHGRNDFSIPLGISCIESGGLTVQKQNHFIQACFPNSATFGRVLILSRGVGCQTQPWGPMFYIRGCSTLMGLGVMILY